MGGVLGVSNPYYGNYNAQAQTSSRDEYMKLLTYAEMQNVAHSAPEWVPDVATDTFINRRTGERGTANGLLVVDKKKETKMGSNYIKEYLVKHRELLMGLAVFILLDKYIFGGAFTEKIKAIAHNVLDKIGNKAAEIEHKS